MAILKKVLVIALAWKSHRVADDASHDEYHESSLAFWIVLAIGVHKRAT